MTVQPWETSGGELIENVSGEPIECATCPCCFDMSSGACPVAAPSSVSVSTTISGTPSTDDMRIKGGGAVTVSGKSATGGPFGFNCGYAVKYVQLERYNGTTWVDDFGGDPANPTSYIYLYINTAAPATGSWIVELIGDSGAFGEIWNDCTPDGSPTEGVFYAVTGGTEVTVT